MTQRTFTPSELAQCGQEALNNWDFDVEIDNGCSPEWVEAQKESLDFDADYAENNWADDDGLIRINEAFSDVWDMLYEFSVNSADNLFN